MSRIHLSLSKNKWGALMNRDEIDDLWSEYVGSRRMYWWDELRRLNELQEEDLSWKIIYHLYLSSKHWDFMRKKVLARDKYRCVKCSSKDNLHVDHLRYPGIGLETLDDLQTLCHECHEEKTQRFQLSEPKIRKVHIGNQLFETLR